MKKIALLLLTIWVAFSPVAGFGQGALLQGGPWTPGRVPMYATGGDAQAVGVDSGPARGGGNNVGLGELLLIARGTGTPPYVGQGTGPLGTIHCMYDAPTNNASGYHYLCFSPNVNNAGMIAYGAGGIAATQPLNFNINGTAVAPVNCSGSPTSGFAVTNGFVTHC